MKAILIFLGIVAVAIFTGTWIFDAAAWVSDWVGYGLRFLGRFFNFFGWNTGIF